MNFWDALKQGVENPRQQQAFTPYNLGIGIPQVPYTQFPYKPGLTQPRANEQGNGQQMGLMDMLGYLEGSGNEQMPFTAGAGNPLQAQQQYNPMQIPSLMEYLQRMQRR